MRGIVKTGWKKAEAEIGEVIESDGLSQDVSWIDRDKGR